MYPAPLRRNRGLDTMPTQRLDGIALRKPGRAAFSQML